MIFRSQLSCEKMAKRIAMTSEVCQALKANLIQIL